MTRTARAERRLNRAKTIMDDCYSEPLTVANIAEEVGMTRSHFSRAFHRAFAVPPHRYLKELRMERAAELLRETDKPVARICREVGFQSVGSFSLAFKECFEDSPRTFRLRSVRPQEEDR
jgi:transcriptional regulator GlxA family with amidase domain